MKSKPAGAKRVLKQFQKPEPSALGEEHLQRLRRICAKLPETAEKISHGEPTFFTKKKVYAMFANNHHNDGHIAVWIAAPPGLQAMLVKSEPQKFFRPPYVGVKGWIGIELSAISDEELSGHLVEAWRLIAEAAKPRRPKSRRN
jgi:hypothetical protein